MSRHDGKISAESGKKHSDENGLHNDTITSNYSIILSLEYNAAHSDGDGNDKSVKKPTGKTRNDDWNRIDRKKRKNDNNNIIILLSRYCHSVCTCDLNYRSKTTRKSRRRSTRPADARALLTRSFAAADARVQQ